ncbi:MFS transporter [Verrucomicrobia bacterium LW23]|nr:MFS transporter [Verrucomicrobia bacterium LW23]
MTLLCYAAMMSLAIGINLLPVFLTSLREAFGPGNTLSQEQLGRLGALTFAGLVMGIVATGPMADRWGAKLFSLLGNVLIALSLVGMAASPTYGTLCVAMFFMGLGAGVLDMVLSPVVAALNPENRSLAMNWLHSFYCVGAVVTILAGTLALEFGLSWRMCSLLLVPLPVYLIIAFAPLAFPPMTDHNAARTPMTTLLRDRWFLAAIAAIFLGGATELGMAQWLPAYAETSLGFSKWMGGTALLLFSVAMAAGRMAAGSWDARADPCVVMAWGCAATTVLFLCGSFLPSPWLALAACIAAGFTGSALWPTMLAVSADRYPHGGATMFGALAAMGNAGGIFMPWVVGAIADRSNLHWGLAISALAPLLMLPLVLALRKRQAPQAEAATTAEA